MIDVTAALDLLPAVRWPVPPGDLLIAHLAAVRERVARLKERAARRPLAQVALRSPVANPSKIIAAPVNYHKHLEEARADPGLHSAPTSRRSTTTGRSSSRAPRWSARAKAWRCRRSSAALTTRSSLQW